jgi:biotin carboxylase
MSVIGNVVIVDDYAPTRRLAPHFRAAGYHCIRVQSTVEIPPLYRTSCDLDDYLAKIVYTGDLRDTLRALDKYRPVAVVAGSENGVELADALSEALGVATNGTALSPARRDKYTMIETIRGAGLRAARQSRITSEHELRSWHEELGGRVVLKPPRSAASEGVHFCDSPDDSVSAYRKLIGQTNIFAERNDSVVAQEYIAGAEYIVNTVSRAGRHHVCDIWRTLRVDVNGVPDLMAGFYVMPRAGVDQERLVAYAEQVLDAVGIQYGPAHIEIKMTPDGPCLVEIGARVGGMENSYLAELAIGESQMTWTVDAYTNPDRFDRRYQRHYEIRQHVATVVMLSPRRGTLLSYPYLGEAKKLESLHDIRMMVHPGDPIKPTIDDMTQPMIVHLRHPVGGIVMRDMATLRYLDGHAFYEVD